MIFNIRIADLYLLYVSLAKMSQSPGISNSESRSIRFLQ